MEVPFFRPSVGDAEIAAVTCALRSGWLTSGPKTREFETAFSGLMGEGVHSVAVNSATAGLHLGLEAMGVGPGDEVIVPTLTFTATAEVVRYLGADPVFVDVGTDLCIDVAAAEAAITPRTKVLMPVHFAGRSCDMTSLRALANDRGLQILDDAAHALPTRHKGLIIGGDGLADATVFSFYANKTMTTGEGGMLVTRDEALAKRAKVMRLHGIDRDVFDRFTSVRASWLYDVVAPGYKYNLTDPASALGLVQLARCEEFHEARSRLSARYTAAFGDLPLILPPSAAEGDVHSWHLYIVQLSDDTSLTRGEFIEQLQNSGIGCSVHYRPLNQMTFWLDYCKGRSFEVADRYFERCISLPLFMSMSDNEQDYVIDSVTRILDR